MYNCSFPPGRIIMRKKSLAVFASGRGSNFEAIYRQIRSGRLSAEISLIICNNPAAGIISSAEKKQIPVLLLNKKGTLPSLLKHLKKNKIDLIILAGYLRMIPASVIREYKNRILNIHPALLPCFGGPGFYGLRVHKAVLKSGARFSGPTVHFVTPKYDEGPIILQKTVPVLDRDTPETLQKRVLKQEHRLYWKAIELVIQKKYIIQGNRILFFHDA